MGEQREKGKLGREGNLGRGAFGRWRRGIRLVGFDSLLAF